MHLLQKSPKYAFAYARMQMHNYPKPTHHTMCKGITHTFVTGKWTATRFLEVSALSLKKY